MRETASDLARRLAEHAEAVCRHYLSNGRREGRYWLVGDIRNAPGRSLFVRLKSSASGGGAAGKWTDAATGERGDLLDVIRESCGLADFREAADEARGFLNLPRRERGASPDKQLAPAPTGSSESARRLFAMSRPILGTIAEAYLRNRGIPALHETGSLRFHPRCYYRPDHFSPTEAWPAIIAAVTDLGGAITGAHRTWLDPSGAGKAPIGTPRRAMGHLLGHAVRFGVAGEVMAAGEGIETMLSLRCALPTMPMAAALSAAHLAAILFPDALRRLYIARDADPAGDGALSTLLNRGQRAGLEAIALSPRLGDFNEDLSTFGVESMRAALRVQLAPQDVVRFLEWAA
ncbi:MAG TPA: toprim domain-containing protein [Roseiarcus sp.]|nr:toprim domain-containing protein [Roseiarcus sp.]